MRTTSLCRRLGAAFCLGFAVVASSLAAQDVSGITFDVRITTDDSAAIANQSGRGWISGKRTRLDLRGPAAPGLPGMTGENMSVISNDSGGTPVVTMVDHTTKKYLDPSRIMAELQEMMASLPEQPQIVISVTNVVVDTLGAGETISGFATRRFRINADISMQMDMLGESMNRSMHVESEGDYAEELADYSDPLRDSRGVSSVIYAMSWIDSSATTQMQKLAQAVPRGLALRQTDRITGTSEEFVPTGTKLTELSNIKRETFALSVFSIPEGYTELEMPMLSEPN